MTQKKNPKDTKKEKSDKKEKPELGLLEEDDEFEEFVAEEWTGETEQDDTTIWEDNWDDDVIEEDFTKQLRSEMSKMGQHLVIPDVNPVKPN